MSSHESDSDISSDGSPMAKKPRASVTLAKGSKKKPAGSAASPSAAAASKPSGRQHRPESELLEYSVNLPTMAMSRTLVENYVVAGKWCGPVAQCSYGTGIVPVRPRVPAAVAATRSAWRKAASTPASGLRLVSQWPAPLPVVSCEITTIAQPVEEVSSLANPPGIYIGLLTGTHAPCPSVQVAERDGLPPPATGEALAALTNGSCGCAPATVALQLLPLPLVPTASTGESPSPWVLPAGSWLESPLDSITGECPGGIAPRSVRGCPSNPHFAVASLLTGDLALVHLEQQIPLRAKLSIAAPGHAPSKPPHVHATAWHPTNPGILAVSAPVAPRAAVLVDVSPLVNGRSARGIMLDAASMMPSMESVVPPSAVVGAHADPISSAISSAAAVPGGTTAGAAVSHAAEGGAGTSTSAQQPSSLLAFLSDGSALAIGGGSTITCYSSHTCAESATFHSLNAERLTALTTSPLSESVLVGGTSSGSLLLWDCRRGGKPVLALRSHKAGITSIAASHSCPTSLVTGGADSVVALWDISNAAQEAHKSVRFFYKGHSSRVNDVSYCPLASLPNIVASCDDRGVHLWCVM